MSTLSAMAENTNGSPTAPYVAFNTFESFIETLHNTAVPPRINRELMPKMSGVVQTQLLGALRFLGLIDDNLSVREPLPKLAKAFGTKDWAGELRDVVFQAYSTVIGDLDLDTETGTALRAAFRTRGGVDGDTNDKAVRFFIKALEACGATFSPHFKTRRVGVTKTKPATVKPPKAPAPTEANRTEVHTQSHRTDYTGMTAFPIAPNRAVLVPVDISEPEIAVLEAMLPMLRAYVKQNSGHIPATKGGPR